MRLPLMISVTITDRSGRTLSGQTIDAFYASIAHARPFSVGINCALGARDMRPYVAELARIADCYVSCYPNAGLPNAFGEYDEQPADTGGYLQEFAGSGFVNIVGGCCGTTPDHIAAIADGGRGPAAAHGCARVRALASSASSTRFTQFAGLETLTIRPDTQLPDDRRADQRHRLGAVRAADPSRATTPARRRWRSIRCAAAPT